MSPPLVALLLIGILLPAIALMALYARKVAVRRAEQGGLGSGRLHIRLVALFTAIAAVPTVLVAIFASLLFQSGLEFWFSNRARNMLEGAVQVASASYDREVDRVANETVTASGDLAGYFERQRSTIRDLPRLLASSRCSIVACRKRSSLRTEGTSKSEPLRWSIRTTGRSTRSLPPDRIAELQSKQSVPINSSDRIGALTRLNYGPDTYLYEARVFDPKFRNQITRANDVLRDYRSLLNRSRVNQLRFNAALLLGALIIVGLAIFTALKIADRLVRPVGELVTAAGRIEQGDFSARVPVADDGGRSSDAFDRVQPNGRASRRADDRICVPANTQLDARRAFMEAVLSSVTAGVIALDSRNRILLVNRSAEALLHDTQEDVEGKGLGVVSPDLDEFMRGDQSEANVIVVADAGQRTLAVKRVRYQDGSVLTFDDITDQLTDQRRAAWSDIARRIAHEIKNPLTPIQLAAERLQRRFSEEISSDKVTFERLTGTIVRQVGDLRRMVDEFSNFARMPKPVFRDENVHEIARQALFLHEVAHPGLTFVLDPPEGEFRMVCDRRQLAQALTNVVKNGVEAIEGRKNRGEHSLAGDRVELRLHEEDSHLIIDVLDTGVGLPEDRERLTEPYMTTRVRGTGPGARDRQEDCRRTYGRDRLPRPAGRGHACPHRLRYQETVCARFRRSGRSQSRTG